MARLRKWQPHEDEYLALRMKTTPYALIGLALDRTMPAVRHRVYELGLDTKVKPWTRADCKLLLEVGPRQASKLLGRSLYACRKKQTELKEQK